ncbi:putative membrane protein, partial [Enterococcus sp. PF1-24]|nr:putative membrane protein [Enterococcus sp. PFB1-1]MDH6401968.1 putative membrane protein [Enterococcus sp. PF1-24]
MMTKNRMEAFTDAIIAIVMTLLVLELRSPQKPTWQAFLGMEHKLLIYVVSFVSLAIYWNNHHHLLQLVHRIDGRILWANNFFIFTLSLFPFATAWVGDHLYKWPPQAVYGFVIFFADLAYYLLARELIRGNGEDSPIAQLFTNYYKIYFSLGANLVGLLLGYLIFPPIVLMVNVLILLLWLVPDRRIEAHYKYKKTHLVKALKLCSDPKKLDFFGVEKSTPFFVVFKLTIMQLSVL